ncbi:MAG: fimbrial protein [Serratia symbiotica]|nr:fimbrial protein [Serratia symbiotica]
MIWSAAGGVLLPRNVQAASIYRSISPSSGSPPEAKNPLPALRIFLKGQVVPTPVVCSINNEKVIDVVFGELNSADITLDGSHYGKDIAISYSCNSDVNMQVTINLIANNTRFSGDYILTSNPELGVVMKYHSRTIKHWDSFTTHLVSGKGDDWIYFAPVRKAPTRAIPTGKFTASATLVIMIE